jgi:Protein of unknown function (DUF2510)
MATMKHMDQKLPGWHQDPEEVGQLRWWNGNEWTAYVRNTGHSMPRDKSVGVAFALTFFFGPLGLFYVSTSIAVAALIASVVIFVMTLGLGIIVTWPATVVIGCIMADRRHRDYQTWLVARLRTSDGASLAAGGSWPASTPSRQGWAARTTARRNVLFEDARSMRVLSGFAGWQPDPTGRFELRWWSGDTWTPHVMTCEYRTIDPLWKR